MWILFLCVCECLSVLTFWHFYLFIFLQCWGLNWGSSPWATPPAHFCFEYFRDRVSWAICPGWLWNTILLISASWVARITGVSYQHPATFQPLLWLWEGQRFLFCFQHHLGERSLDSWLSPTRIFHPSPITPSVFVLSGTRLKVSQKLRSRLLCFSCSLNECVW
jgi:hypothetical protein